MKLCRTLKNAVFPHKAQLWSSCSTTGGHRASDSAARHRNNQQDVTAPVQRECGLYLRISSSEMVFSHHSSYKLWGVNRWHNALQIWSKSNWQVSNLLKNFSALICWIPAFLDFGELLLNCVGEHVIIALFTFSLNLFLEKEALTLKICKMLKIMLVLLQKNVNMNDVKPQKFKPRSLIYLNLTKHPDPSGHRETSTLYSRLKTEKGEARASWTPEVCWNWSQLPWVWMVLYRYTCLSGSFVNHSHRHVYCLHRYSTLRTGRVACFRCV